MSALWTPVTYCGPGQGQFITYPVVENKKKDTANDTGDFDLDGIVEHWTIAQCCISFLLDKTCWA